MATPKATAAATAKAQAAAAAAATAATAAIAVAGAAAGAAAPSRLLARKRREPLAGQRSRQRGEGHPLTGPVPERFRSGQAAGAQTRTGATKRGRATGASVSQLAIVKPSKTSTRVTRSGVQRTGSGCATGAGAGAGRKVNPKQARQMQSNKPFMYSNTYDNNLCQKETRMPMMQWGRQAPDATRTRNRQLLSKSSLTCDHYGSASQAHPLVRSGPKMRNNFKSIKAKVDSHLCTRLPGHGRRHSHGSSADPGPLPCPGGKSKSLAEAHEQLEMLLTRIERANEYVPPGSLGLHLSTSAASAAARARTRMGQGTVGPMPGRMGPKIAKGMRRQMGPAPPAPAASPMISARQNYFQTHPSLKLRGRAGLGGLREPIESDLGMEEYYDLEQEAGQGAEGEPEQQVRGPGIVPLVSNPQHLPPGKREALLALLQRAGQHDKGIVDIVRGMTAAGEEAPSRETMLMMLQMLPLSLKESPYSEKFWEEHRYQKEQQELQQKQQAKEAARQLEEDTQLLRQARHRRQHHQAVSNINLDCPLNERQEQAMRERAELEEHKQQVTLCRERRRQKEYQKQLAAMLKEQQQEQYQVLQQQKRQQQQEQEQGQSQIRLKDPLSVGEGVTVSDPWEQLLRERDRFQAQCKRSCFYNNSRSSTPWRVYAQVAASLSSQLVDSVDDEFNRSVANYINDYVDTERPL